MTLLVARWLPGRFGVYQLPAAAPVPEWASSGAFTTVSRGEEELSVLCAWHANPARLPVIGPLSCCRLEGPLDFSETGILARLTAALAADEVSVLCVATHDTDYLLVLEAAREPAQMCLQRAGVSFPASDPAGVD